MKYARFIPSYELYNYIPMKAKSVLPDEGFGWRWQDLTGQGHMFYITCLPKPSIPERETVRRGRWISSRPHNSKHRIFVTCKCGKEIPFGRLGQHRKACKALQWYTEVKEIA